MRTSHRLLLVSPLSSIVMLCWAPPALAQGVYKCTLAGKVVYQSSPCMIEAQPAAAAPAAGTATDTVASNANAPAPPKKKTLADMLRERDAATPPQRVIREFQPDGANVLRSRMGAV